MKFLRHLLIVSVAAGLGLAVGFAWRGTTARDSKASEFSGAIAPKPTDSRMNSFRATRKFTILSAHDDSPLATQLERDLSMSAGVTRWLYWLEGIEKASLSDFPRLARLAKGDATATRLLASRWVELDLRHLFDTLAGAQDQRGLPAEELASVLFHEWPKRDPDAAIAALSGTNNFGTRETWRWYVAGLLAERDPERGLRVLSEWRIDNFVPHMPGLAQWAAANPRHAAEVTLAHPAGYASRQALETIGKEWAKTEPAQALEFASSRPGKFGTTLANNVLRNWARQNLKDAAAWLAGADVPTRHRLSPALVEAWAKHDANGALAWSESNLAGRGFARAVGGILQVVAQADMTAAAGYVADMKPSPARAEAAAAVAANWFPGSLSGKSVPPAAIAWMGSLDAESGKRALEQVQWKWSICDPKSMAEYLAMTGSERVHTTADFNLARALARQDPAEALAWARRLPAERGLAAGREAFAEWLRSQPQSAMNWLGELPSSDPRREPFLRYVVR